MYYRSADERIIRTTVAPNGAQALWGAEDAAQAWGITRRRAMQIMPRVPGYWRGEINGRITALIPAGSMRPEFGKPGPKGPRRHTHED